MFGLFYCVHILTTFVEKLLFAKCCDDAGFNFATFSQQQISSLSSASNTTTKLTVEMTRQSVSTLPSFREQKKCCVDFVTKFQFFKVKGFLRPRHLKAMMRVGVDQNIVAEQSIVFGF